MSKYGWLIFFLLGSVGWSQEARATIGGRVTDAQGAAVPDAVVVVIDDDNGVKQQTRTNTQGNWTVQFLLPGHYQFTVTAPGFKTENRQGFTLQTADNKQIDIQLEVGSSPQSVEVTAEAPLIDTTSATSGTPLCRRCSCNDQQYEGSHLSLSFRWTPHFIAGQRPDGLERVVRCVHGPYVPAGI